MSKIQSISRYTITYNRANIYDDTIVEKKSQTSYIEMDERGNVVEDKTFDNEGNPENHIRRTFNAENQLLTESFIDAYSDEVYETRYHSYNGDALLTSTKIKYPEDEIEQQYIYSPQGKLLQKKVNYLDAYNYIEKEYVWENDHLQKIIEKDEDEMVSTQNMLYHEDGNIAELEVIEHLNNDLKQTERYDYENGQITRQEIFNYKGDVMTTIESKYDGELLLERSIESGTQFFKHVYKYDENGRKTQESVLNRDDLPLIDYIIEYNEEGLETSTKKYSLNIVDDEKELILIEEILTEYAYFE